MADYSFKVGADVKEAQSALNGLAKAATGLVAALAIGSFFKKAIEEAKQGAKAIDDLNIALSLSGQLSEENTARFEELGSALQKTSIFADDAVLGAARLALNLGATADNAELVVKAAADLAAATGTDLNTATEALTKSLQGQGRQLAQLVPQTKGLKEEALRAGAALQFVSQRFSGAAEAAGNTFSGSITKAANSFNDFLKAVGQFVIYNPVIIFGIKQISELFNELTTFLNKNKETIMLLVNVGFLTLVRAVEYIIAGVGTLTSAFQFLSKISQLLFNNFVQLTRLVGFVLGPAVNGLAQLVALAARGILKLVSTLANLPGVGSVFKSLGVDVNELNSGIESVDSTLSNFIDNVDVTKLSDSLQEFGDGVYEAAIGGAESFKETLASSEVTVQKFGNKIESLIGVSVESAVKNGSADGFKNIDEGALQKLKDKIQKAYTDALSNPSEGAAALLNIKINKEFANEFQASLAGSLAGLTNLVAQGAEGGKKAVVQAMTLGATALLGPFGQALGPLFDLLAQGPEAVQKLIEQFIQAIPLIIENIVLSIPVVMDTIVEQLPFLVQRLAELMPGLAVSLGLSLGAQMPFVATQLSFNLIAQSPNIAKGFVDAMIKEAGRLITAIADGVKGAISSVTGLGGGGGLGGGLVGGLLGGVGGSLLGGGIGKKFKFAEGGMVPGGAPYTDRVNALLTPGEVVLSRDQVAAAEADKVNVVSAINNLAASIGGGGGQNMTLNVNVSEENLARILLNINRQGFRVA